MYTNEKDCTADVLCTWDGKCFIGQEFQPRGAADAAEKCPTKTRNFSWIAVFFVLLILCLIPPLIKICMVIRNGERQKKAMTHLHGDGDGDYDSGED